MAFMDKVKGMLGIPEDTDMEVTQGAPFESFGLSEATMRAIRNKHYTVSTPVQAGCIPPMMAGRESACR